MRHGAKMRHVRRGRGPNGVTNVGGSDGGAQLTVAKGVALRETCTGEAIKECLDSEGGGVRATSRNVEGVRRSMTAV